MCAWYSISYIFEALRVALIYTLEEKFLESHSLAQCVILSFFIFNHQHTESMKSYWMAAVHNAEYFCWILVHYITILIKPILLNLRNKFQFCFMHLKHHKEIQDFPEYRETCSFLACSIMLAMIHMYFFKATKP